MRTLGHVITMWIVGWLAAIAATFRRLVLGPTLPSWTWRTEWTVAFARAVIANATRYADDAGMASAGLSVTAPVPRDVRKRVDVRRVDVGDVVADRYMPTGVLIPQRTILYFHGGGYVFGNPGTHRQFIARLVDATGAGAVAPRYRLAPEHPYPAAVDDAETAYRAILDAGIDPNRVVVAGDSAGGGLALALVHRIRTKGLAMPSSVMVFSPYTDLEHRSYTIRTNARTDYLPSAAMTGPNDWYCRPDELRDPEVSPIHGDLTGFPPLLVFAGGAEMILGDSLLLAEAADRDGVDATLVVEPEMVHVWPAIVDWEPATQRCLTQARDWLESREGGS